MKVLNATIIVFFLTGFLSLESPASAQECVVAVRGKSRVVSRKNPPAQRGTDASGQDTVEVDTPENKATAKKDGRKIADPQEVFSDIEKGWSTEQVDMILRHFGRNKVTIAIEGTGPSGGRFSRNQSYYLLTDMFKYTITRKFEIVQYQEPDEKGNASFVVAERYYQKTDDGRLFKDKIYISLHLQQGESSAGRHWVVDEIKSIR